MISWGIGDDCSDPIERFDGEWGNAPTPSDEESSVIEGTARTISGRRNVYKNKLKADVIAAIRGGEAVASVAVRFRIKSRTAIYRWLDNEARISAACANHMSSKTTLGGQGRPCGLPFVDELVQWVKQMRRDDFPLKTAHVIAFVCEEYPSWANAYLDSSQEESLSRRLRRALRSRGFSFRRPTKTILSSADLVREQRQFADTVGSQISKTYARDCIFNADETGVLYDDDPGTILCEQGHSHSAKIPGRPRSERVSVLLTISATGKKLPPLIIFKGTPGGPLEREVAGFSPQVTATVQRNAWMDSQVWCQHFIHGEWASFIASEFPGPLAIYVDNLKCHVSQESQEAFAAWGTEVVPLPKNTTSILQPLDVGVMGPFKKKLRAITLSYELHQLRENAALPLRERLLTLARLPGREKRKLVVDRIIRAWDSIDEQCIRRAWQKSGL